MKVAILVHRFDPYVGGAENFARGIAEGLVQLGQDVTVFTSHHSGRDTTPRSYAIRSLRSQTPVTKGYFFWPASLGPGVQRELASHDVIHVVDASMWVAPLARLVKRRKRVPYTVTTLYHPPAYHRYVGAKRLYDRTILRSVLNHADDVFVLSQAETTALRLGTGYKGSVTRIPCGGASTTESTVKREGPFRALYVGRIDSHKGIQDIMSALPHLQEQVGAEWAIDIVGDTAAWFKKPTSYKGDDRVRFLGPLAASQLDAAYRSADLLLFPSRYETFGIVLIEAMSRGTPVLSTRVGIAPEVITDNKNGFLYDAGDIHGFVDGFCRAVRADLARSTDITSAVSGFTWENAAKRINDAHLRIMNARQR